MAKMTKTEVKTKALKLCANVEEVMAKDEALARIEILKASAKEMADEYNNFMANDENERTADYEVIVRNLLDRVEMHQKNIKFNDVLETENPLMTVTMDWHYPSIKMGIKKATATETQRMEINKTDRVVKLRELDLYSIKQKAVGIAADSTWYQKLETLNAHLTARKYYLVNGHFGQVLQKFRMESESVSYFRSKEWAEFLEECKSDKAWSNNALKKSIQAVFDALYGEGIVEVRNAHMNFLDYVHSKDAREPDEMRIVKTRAFANSIMGCARNYLENGHEFMLAYSTQKPGKENAI